jgi:pimeloyl-ACP methyl ester carboxylesterase
MAQDLLDTLDESQIEKATFIGHSMGGKAVMALTALAPERIAAWSPLISPRWIITSAVMMKSSPPSMPSPTRGRDAPAGGGSHA